MALCVSATDVPKFAPAMQKNNFAKRIVFLDTTLRDGEQTPGVAFSREGKIEIAKALSRMGVDIIEAGSPVSGKAEKDAVRAVRELGLTKKGKDGPEEVLVSAFARMVRADIGAVSESGAHMVSLVFPSSHEHMSVKLGTVSEGEVLDELMKCQEYALRRGLRVELLAEDGSRASPEFLRRAALAGQANGADGFCMCDTVGIMAPEMAYALYAYLREGLNIRLGFHGHNDSSMVVASSLAALRAGADEVHGTVNGLGERAGNGPLEAIAHNLKNLYGISTLDLKQVYRVSKLVAGYSNLYPAWNAPLVGRNAFRHESGIHVNGVTAHQGKDGGINLYQGVDPRDVGREHEITLGKLSGKASIEFKLAQMGISVQPEAMDGLLQGVKELGESGVDVSDAHFSNLARRARGEGGPKVEIEEILVTTGNKSTPSAHVRLKVSGRQEFAFGASLGDGPVDAAIRAIKDGLSEEGVALTSFHVDSIGEGSEARVRVNMRVQRGGQSITSSGFGTDVVLASTDAYVRALNALL